MKLEKKEYEVKIFIYIGSLV